MAGCVLAMVLVGAACSSGSKPLPQPVDRELPVQVGDLPSSALAAGMVVTGTARTDDEGHVWADIHSTVAPVFCELTARDAAGNELGRASQSQLHADYSYGFNASSDVDYIEVQCALV